MRYFPLFFDLLNARVVVVGGGEEALRKIRLLLKTQAKIEVVAETLHPELLADRRVTWKAKSYDSKHLDGATLVFSSVPELNARVSADAYQRNIPVNAVDNAALSCFIIPSIVDRNPVVVAIGTEGAAPILAQSLRAKIDAFLPATLGPIARRAAALRHVVAEKLSPGQRRRNFWADFFFGSVAESLKHNDEVAYELAVGDALFNHAHETKGRLTIIGVPSDIDDLTIKAQRRLMEADVIGRSAGVSPALNEMARRDAVRLDVHDTGALIKQVQQSQLVVVLGDAPHLATEAEAHGIAVEVLPHMHHVEDIQPLLEKAAP
jgi:uroporphyrin-III C-methyltransferase / precorrin-2 dehydrogenase / sirohydrochlorin ferrochelatase